MSKLSNLNNVKQKVSLFNVPYFSSINAVAFKKEHSIELIKNVVRPFKGKILVIRSSAFDEDTLNFSYAGEYESIIGVPSNDYSRVEEAIDKVIASYEKKRALSLDDEVILQVMAQNTSMSGVIFTHDLNTGAPYYVVNYDDQSGLTDTVTSGEGEFANRSIYIYRKSINQLRSERFIKLLQAVQELEGIMENQFLDIEFAIGKDLTIYLLQVREMTTQPNWNRATTKRIDTMLQGVKALLIERFKKINSVYGDTTLLGQMPDWNPVEMIGRVPRALATSLYQTLITDYAWSSARESMGYAVPTGQPLLITLAGQPFIDTRLSFHSFLPDTIPPAIAEKLVNHWLNKLKESPDLHDKVEFDIAITTFSFDINDKMKLLIEDALTDSEKEKFKQAHLKQTRGLITGKGVGSLTKALDSIKKLKARQDNLNSSELPTTISSIFTIVSDCIHYGTIPFSILARHGFIAKTILLSLAYLGIITKDEVNQFQGTIQTVASDLVDDMYSLQLGKLTNTEFMSQYGHLRPGTYDITSSRYDQMGDISSGIMPAHQKGKIEQFQFSQKQTKQINRLLEDNGFNDFRADDLLNYMREAIIGREYGKFVFTRSVSDLLEIIANFAEENRLSRNEISHVPLHSILEVFKGSSEYSIEDRLRDVSELEKEKHQTSVAIRLPQLITDQAGVYIIPFQTSHPNFITHKVITAQCLILSSEVGRTGLSLKDKVILIEGADPGYDWIFSQKIAGLITKYGGANSHMAIRCAEFAIPAAIGCGELYFSQLIRSNRVHLDCSSGLLTPLV